MNLERARELYSDYLEGSLDGALKASLEAEIARDQMIRKDFESFKSFYSQLGTILNVKAPVELDIEEKVKQRLDLASWEAKRSSPNRWFSQLRFGLVGALSLAVIAVAYISLNKNSAGPVGSGAFGLGGNQYQFQIKNGQYDFEEAPPASQATTIVITDLQDNHIISSSTSAKGTGYIEIPIQNNGVQAKAVQVAIPNQNKTYVLVMPGSKIVPQQHGHGNVVDMAKALANTYKVPVLLLDVNFSKDVAWNFAGTDARDNAMSAVQPLGWSVDRQQQFIRIQTH